MLFLLIQLFFLFDFVCILLELLIKLICFIGKKVYLIIELLIFVVLTVVIGNIMTFVLEIGITPHLLDNALYEIFKVKLQLKTP